MAADVMTGWLREWGSSLVVGGALATVAAVTGFISYTHICALTLALHQSWKTAHLMPLAVDGQIIIGGAVLATLGRGRWWGLLGVAPGLAESLFANWESGIQHGHLAAVWATVAAQSFACSSLLFEKWLRNRVSALGQGGEVSAEDALRLLLASGSERAVAELLDVERSQVQRWKRQLTKVAAAGEDAA
jgi:hypothetical protein